MYQRLIYLLKLRMASNEEREELKSIAHQLCPVIVDDLDEHGQESVPHLTHTLLIASRVLQRERSRLEEQINVVRALIILVGRCVLDELLEDLPQSFSKCLYLVLRDLYYPV